MPEESYNPKGNSDEFERLALDTAMEAGHILLENGAEIFRVEETMERICKHYEVEAYDFFVLSNGIFTTGGNKKNVGMKQYARVQHIPVKGTKLDRVIAVNQLSREIEEGKWTLEQAREKLEDIRNMPGKPLWAQVLSSGIGAAAFCMLFGGSLVDASVALLAGILLWLYIVYVSAPYMSKIIGNITGGALVTIVCILAGTFGWGHNVSRMIIGSIIPLVPGVPFTNGIRDIADGDYISGSVRLLDAILVFLCVAIGVGTVFGIYHTIGGGILI